VIVMVLAVSSVQAADLTWDHDADGTASDGSGTWLNANQWVSGGSSTNWDNATPDNATIGSGGGGGTITLGAVTAGTVVMDNFALDTTYVLNSGSLAQSGGITIGPNCGTVDIRSSVSGAGGLTTDGVYVQLRNVTTGNLSYNGATVITNGGQIMTRNGSNIELPNSNVRIHDGIFNKYYDGTIKQALGTAGGEMQILGGESGFSGNRNLDVIVGNNASLQVTWGSAYFNPSTLILMGPSANTYGTTELKNPLDLNGATRTVACTKDNTSDTGYGALNGVVSNGGAPGAGLIKKGVGRFKLTANNTFDGPVEVHEGILSIPSINNVASANPLGQSSAAAANLSLSNNATLQYTGSGGSCDRSFTINGTAAGHSATLDASGSGALNLTATGSPAYGTGNQTRTLNLAGSSTADNTLAANIADNLAGVVSVTKTGAGVWMLTGSSTYTGGSTASAGALVAEDTAALPGYNFAGKVVFNGGTIGVADVNGAGWSGGEIDTLIANATRTSGYLGIHTGAGDLTQWKAFTSAWLGPLGIAKLGSNKLTLDQSNTYTGGTRVASGTLQGSAAGAFGTGEISIESAGTLQLSHANAAIGSSAISIEHQNATLTLDNDSISLSNLNINCDAYTFDGNALNFVSGGTIDYPANSANNMRFRSTVTGSPEMRIAAHDHNKKTWFEPTAGNTQTWGRIVNCYTDGSGDKTQIYLAGATTGNTIESIGWEVCHYGYMDVESGEWTVNGNVEQGLMLVDGGTIIINGTFESRYNGCHSVDGKLGGDLTMNTASYPSYSDFDIRTGGILAPGDGGVGTITFNWGNTPDARTFHFNTGSDYEWDVGAGGTDVIDIVRPTGGTLPSIDLDDFTLVIQDATSEGQYVSAGQQLAIMTYTNLASVDISGFNDDFDTSALSGDWEFSSLALVDSEGGAGGSGTIYVTGLSKPAPAGSLFILR